MLAESVVATRLPARDLERARAFYSQALGLEPVEERPGGLLYRCGRGEFALFETEGAASGSHTQMTWEVPDIELAVRQLSSRGVVFEEYELPGLETVGGIATVEGNYPSKGGFGERAAWFRDSEGNLLAIGERFAASVSPRRIAASAHAAIVSSSSPPVSRRSRPSALAPPGRSSAGTSASAVRPATRKVVPKASASLAVAPGPRETAEIAPMPPCSRGKLAAISCCRTTASPDPAGRRGPATIYLRS